jgi:hypothetical protein
MSKAMTTENTIKKKIKQPIIVETISSAIKEKQEGQPVFQKKIYLTKVPVPDGHVRVIVLHDYKGMIEDLYEGDVQDLPARRFKSLANRGLVKIYDGERPPNKLR